MLDDGIPELELEPDPDDTSETLTRGQTRVHAIVLCCAHSVVELVEEVARNLRGLGFDTEVVTGAEARTALLGHGTDAARPTIYVVCVQGALKEQVLKPLRQALATHGGPNAHLFAAVLDLSLPLAMVGQIRRFAEALGRPKRRKDGLGERRQWREQLGVSTERVATRSYRAIEPLTRDTGSSPAVDAVHRTGPQAVIGSARPAPVDATDKYRAVTGSVPTAPVEAEEVDAETSGRRPRRTRAPKIRVKALPAKGARRAAEPLPAIAGESGVTGDTVVARAPAAVDDAPARDTVIVTPSPRTADHDSPAPAVLPLAPPDDLSIATLPVERSPMRWPMAAAAVVVLAGGVGWWWMTQRNPAPASNAVAQSTVKDAAPGPAEDPRETPVAAAAAIPAARVAAVEPAPTAAIGPVPTADAAPTDAAPTADAPTDAAPTDAAPAPGAPAVAPPPAPAEPAPTPDTAPSGTPPGAPPSTDTTPAPTVEAATPTADSDVEDTAPSSATLPALADAIASRRIRVTDRLYLSTTRATAATWSGARATCEALAIDGVDGFRLPHRRELQMLSITRLVREGPHWSRTVPDDDTESAYVLHASTGQLVVWSKDEAASVVCVRPR